MNDKKNMESTQSPLLVPMNIEALVVPEKGSGATTWLDLRPDFRGIKKNKFLGQDLETNIATNKQQKLHKPGVHLHWALPDGLCHGTDQGSDDEPTLPTIPNRWLIIRFCDHSKAGEPTNFKHKAWVLESDYIYGVDETRDGSPVTFPNLDKETLFDYVGKTFEYESWLERHKEYRIDLTAMGYGDPAFAGYYPASRGILGFHDKDISELEKHSVNYCVVGWYSDTAKDPLHVHETAEEKVLEHLEEFLAERGWTYPGFDKALAKERALNALAVESQDYQQRLQEVENMRAAMPDRILCHGVISTIFLDEKPFRSGVPKNSPTSIAVGNTAIEALTASFRNTLNNDDLVRLLETFQYDLLSELEKPNGDAIVEQKVHERTFRPVTRGVRWALIQQEAASHAGVTETKAPPIPGDIRVLLQNLNVKQSEINRLKRARDTLKSELYARWYKRIQKKISADSEESLKTKIEKLTQQIIALEDQALKRPKGGEWDLLQGKIKAFLPGYTLQQLDEPRFWRPNDPVLLFTGEAFKRSNRHGEDGRFHASGRLLCRLGSQALTALKMTVANAKKVNVEFGPDDLDKWCKPLGETAQTPLPATIAGLFRESLFLTLNRQRCQHIAVAVYEKNEKGLADAHPNDVTKFANTLFDEYLKKIWQDAKNVELDDPSLNFQKGDTTGLRLDFMGKLPSPVALSTWTKNPWIPMFLYWDVDWQPEFSEEKINLDDWNLTPSGTAFTWSNKSTQGKLQKYQGTTLLTASAALTFSERLRQYSLSHDDSTLKEFMTEVRSMNLLCQSLGGFTDQLLMRKARMELHPLEPGATKKELPKRSAIFDLVEDIDWLSPLTDKAFLPLRAGQLTLNKLWVIDAFGQVLELEDISEEEKNKAGSFALPLVPERLASKDGAVRFDPRLAQATRLNLFWPPASRYGTGGETNISLHESEDSSPVCGWILSNYLDSSLMIYDASGNALGALQAVQRKSWDAGVGSHKAEIESFHWVDIPGSKDFYFGRPPEKIEDPLGESANPHLRDFVKGLLALSEGSGQVFNQLLHRINESASATAGTSASDNPNLALLIGKPLALIRASIHLELDGRAAANQDWDDASADQKEKTGGLENLTFPLRLGDRRQWNDMWVSDDGLVGFYLAQDYSRFYPAYGMQGNNDAYSEYDYVARLSLAEPLDLTLLMDPAKGVCATTGILPRKIFKLPYGDISDTLENKQIVFFTGPVVSAQSDEKITMPPPSDSYGQWSWTHHPEVEVWREAPIADSSLQQGQFIKDDDAFQITEGWLKLITAALSIRDFSVNGMQPKSEEQKPKIKGETPTPAVFEVPKGNMMTLCWTVTGAETIELQQEGTVLFKSDRHPLPGQFAVQINQSSVFSLTVSDRAQHTRQKHITIHVI